MANRAHRSLQAGDFARGILYHLIFFLLCAEELSAMLQDATTRKEFVVFKLCRGGPEISHLFYADDSMIFSKAEIGYATKIADILRTGFGTESKLG